MPLALLRKPLPMALALTAPLFCLLACHREDPHIRALTEQAAQSDEAAQQLRQAWSRQFGRLSRARVPGLRFGREILLTPEQKRVLEQRVHWEKDSSRQALLREILDKDQEIQALQARVASLKAALPAPEVAGPLDSHYGLALRFLRQRGIEEESARRILSRATLMARILPGYEITHFYEGGTYGSWVSQGQTPLPPSALEAEDLASERDAAQALGERLRRDLGRLEIERQAIARDIADLRQERSQVEADRALLHAENEAQQAQLNSLHYLVGRESELLEKGLIRLPFFGQAASGPAWNDASFTKHLDLRTERQIQLRAEDYGLARLGRIRLIPASILLGIHYRLTFSPDGRSVTVDLLDLSRFRNDKVILALSE